jgi:anaerobic ribonucleoside-triphosphate reductase
MSRYQKSGKDSDGHHCARCGSNRDVKIFRRLTGRRFSLCGGCLKRVHYPLSEVRAK